jgi:hypothetical protein
LLPFSRFPFVSLRPFCAAVALALAVTASGTSNALVLMSGEDAGPHIRVGPYVEPNWALWPATSPEAPHNRLLSVLSGLDWTSTPQDLAFRPAEPNSTWAGSSEVTLEQRGYFRALARQIGNTRVVALMNASGAIPPEVMLLAQDSEQRVKPIAWSDSWPTGTLLIGSAHTWDEVKTIEDWSRGRVLVVEWPPKPGQSYGRIWFRGTGWPARQVRSPEIKVPGILYARDLGGAVVDPNFLQWQEPSETYGLAPERFLHHVRVDGPILLTFWAFVASVAGVLAAVCIGAERRIAVMALFLRAVGLFPVALAVTGAITRYVGLDGMLAILVVSWLVVLGLTEALRLALRKWDDSAATGVAFCIVALLGLGFGDPAYSLFNSHLGSRAMPVPPELVGVGLFALCRLLGSRRLAWWGLGALAAVAGVGLWGSVWWSQDPFLAWALLIPILSVTGTFSWLLLIPIAISASTLARNGTTWMPSGLATMEREWRQTNLAQVLQFLLSPALIWAVILVGGVALFGSRFLGHQMRRLLAFEPERRAPFLCAAVTLLCGVFQPALLHAGLVVGLYALGQLLHDGVNEL